MLRPGAGGGDKGREQDAVSRAGHRSGQGKGLGEPPAGRVAGVSGLREHDTAPPRPHVAPPPHPRALRPGPAPQPIPARRRGVAAPACGLRRVGGPEEGPRPE